MPNIYKLMCFDRNINGNRDVKFLECDYWSLHAQKEESHFSKFLSVFFRFLISTRKILCLIQYAQFVVYHSTTPTAMQKRFKSFKWAWKKSSKAHSKDLYQMTNTNWSSWIISYQIVSYLTQFLLSSISNKDVLVFFFYRESNQRIISEIQSAAMAVTSLFIN